eukprot:scaffold129914_cov59-Attheya_sp.AAC.1
MAFALTPAPAIMGVLDLAAREGSKIYSSATKELTKGLSEELYDCTPDGLFNFLETLGDRAHECGWLLEDVGILYIPEDPANPNTTTYLNLLTHYGQIQPDEIRAHENVYITLPCRSAQDTGMLYKCIIKEHSATFDTDSGLIGVDNRCSGCISHIAEDFIGELRDSGRVIKGFGGTKTTGIKIGTLLWKWCDNEGQEHKFKIPNSFYVPHGGVRLLSPHHWAKAQGDRKPVEGTGETTNSKEVILYWNQHKHKLTIPLSVATNVATFRTAPGYGKFDAFCAEAGFTSVDDEEPPLFLCQEANLISDDEDDDKPAIEHNPAAI